jgi:nucleoside-diphosphate-sugar epimerase
MRVFVTGASGHIGSAVVPELLEGGHDVVGLARSDRAAAVLAGAGAAVQRGALDDLDGLREAAAAADGVIHLAFKHELMRSGDFASAVTADLRAVEALGDAISGTGKPFVGTSGTLMLTLAGLGRIGTEADAIEGGPRVDAENAVIAMAPRGVRSSIVRLPPTVHSALDYHGYIPMLIAIARDKGVAGYIGDGSNRWPAVHTLDAARLYRKALEAAPAGTRLHGVADEGIPLRQIAEEIGRQLTIPAVSIPPEDAEEHFGFLALFVMLDNPTSGTFTQELLDWQPAHAGLIEDLRKGHYFTSQVG